jgi:hypothetical protein
MREETKCPHCGAEERGDYIPGVNTLWWECGNNEYLIEREGAYPDECRIRELEDRCAKLQSAWIGMKTELVFLAHSEPEIEVEMIDIIHHWEDNAIFIPGKNTP